MGTLHNGRERTFSGAARALLAQAASNQLQALNRPYWKGNAKFDRLQSFLLRGVTNLREMRRGYEEARMFSRPPSDYGPRHRRRGRTTMTPSHGTFTWNELNTHDSEKAKAFYRATVGWTFDAMPMGDAGTYWIAKQGETPAGGIFPLSDPMFATIPDHWLSYLEVDDIDARVARVPAAGGMVMRPPFDIPGVGRIAIVKDVNGAVMGWMTSIPR
jgi:predicted enzyme related to lactoylglutathione lyase